MTENSELWRLTPDRHTLYFSSHYYGDYGLERPRLGGAVFFRSFGGMAEILTRT
jgi:hypothetical protein